MPVPNQFRFSFALAVCLASGCHLFPDQPLAKGHSPLKPALPSSDSVAMEIIWARFPANDPVLDAAAWREIDETQIDPSVRRELLDNGLRAGVIGTSVPAAIIRVLHQGDSPSADEDQKTTDAKNSGLITEPVVHGHRIHVRRNQRNEIQASDVYATLPLLESGGAELGGHTYQQAQAIYALRVDPQPDRTVMVELTPELHYGEPKLRFTSGEDRLLRQASLRDRKVFEKLQMSVRLTAGEMLVLTCLPNSGSQLGHYFHTANSNDGLKQKLILIRLAEVPPSDTFAYLRD